MIIQSAFIHPSEITVWHLPTTNFSQGLYFSPMKRKYFGMCIQPCCSDSLMNSSIKHRPEEEREVAQSLGSIISILHTTTSFCAWAINAAIIPQWAAEISLRLGSVNSALHLKWLWEEFKNLHGKEQLKLLLKAQKSTPRHDGETFYHLKKKTSEGVRTNAAHIADTEISIWSILPDS